MKKFIFILFAVIMVFLAFSQGPPSNGLTAGGNYFIRRDTIISLSAFDTLGAADSTYAICSLCTISPEWEYIYQRNAFTGTGSDSVSVLLRIDIIDTGATVVLSSTIDSFTAAAGEAVILPVNRSLFGRKFTLKLLGFGDDGTQLIINRQVIWKRKVFNIRRNWIE